MNNLHQGAHLTVYSREQIATRVVGGQWGPCLWPAASSVDIRTRS